MEFKILLLLIILTLGIFLRLYQLDEIPPGLNLDEASIGYNAYALLQTGKDRYGQTLPVAFRSFGSYIMPVYTYLTTIPVAFFGPTIFSVHFISALSSVLLILLTAVLVFEMKKITYRGKLLSVLFISISPWSILFGRAGYELNLSLALFALSIFLFIKSISNPKWIILTFLMAGISGSTYYTERYLNLILFPLLIWLFKDKFIKYKSYLFIGVILFVLAQLPQLELLQSEAFIRRIEQVNYWNDRSFNDNGGNLRYIPSGKLLYILNEFTSHYLEYFSPRSLFFDPDPQNVRSIPNLSVFYVWMVIPLWFGIKFLLKNKSEPIFKILLLILVVSPIPAALTGDPFYSARALSFLWILTILIAFGSDYLLGLIGSSRLKIVLVTSIPTFSLISLYNSYFILLKYERADSYGYQYRELVNKLQNYKDKKVVIDTERSVGAHIWIAFYGKIDPIKYQSQTSDAIKNNYYNNTDLDTETNIDHFEIRPIVWKEDIYEDKIVVGDEHAISNEQIQEHRLSSVFQIVGLDGKIKLIAYKTNPKEKCRSDWEKGLRDPKCAVFFPL